MKLQIVILQGNDGKPGIQGPIGQMGLLGPPGPPVSAHITNNTFHLFNN